MLMMLIMQLMIIFVQKIYPSDTILCKVYHGSLNSVIKSEEVQNEKERERERNLEDEFRRNNIDPLGNKKREQNVKNL